MESYVSIKKRETFKYYVKSEICKKPTVAMTILKYISIIKTVEGSFKVIISKDLRSQFKVNRKV